RRLWQCVLHSGSRGKGHGITPEPGVRRRTGDTRYSPVRCARRTVGMDRCLPVFTLCVVERRLSQLDTPTRTVRSRRPGTGTAVSDTVHGRTLRPIQTHHVIVRTESEGEIPHERLHTGVHTFEGNRIFAYHEE